MNDVYLRFVILIFLFMYTCTLQWHYGNAPDQPPIRINYYGDGLCQGETVVNVFFDILSARLYKAYMEILNGRGILLAIADDVKMCASPFLLTKIVGKLPAPAMSEAGLATQASKNRVYGQPSAKSAWIAYLDAKPRCEDSNVISLHDNPNGRLHIPDESKDVYYDPNQRFFWQKNDGINILGTSLGSLEFVKEYLQGKLDKHNILREFIVDVDNMGFSREAHTMLV